MRALVMVLVAGTLMVGVGRTQAALAATAPALPLGTDGQGAHLVWRDRQRELVLTFDASAAARFRQLAGRLLDINCVRFDPQLGGSTIIGGAEGLRPAPRRRRPIVFRFRRRLDYCSIGVLHGEHRMVLTRIALTPLGAVRLDERNTAATVITAVHMLARPARPSAAQVAARLHGVALDSPGQAPRPGTLGVYSDGAAHVYAAQADRAGTLLFVEEDGEVTRTDLMDYLTDPYLLES